MKPKVPGLALALLLILSSLPLGSGCSRTDSEAGRASTYTVGEVEFTLRYAPPATFPMGLEDELEGVVDKGFWIGETEVPYELWYEVRTWAEENGYRFEGGGREGSHGRDGHEPSDDGQHPVVRITLYDAMAWCNALSEYLGYTPLYVFWDEPFRDATNQAAGDLTIALKEVGFRLPTHQEWELAARYRGGDRRGAIEYPRGSRQYWTPGSHASGSPAPYTDEGATLAVAWYEENSALEGRRVTSQPVGQKPDGGNALNLYDMSGNVYEWIHRHPGDDPACRGGCYHRGAEYLQVGDENPRGVPDPGNIFINVGMRLVLSEEVGEVEFTWDDEVVYPAGSLVQVESGSRWWNAQVLETDRGLYYITYDGSSSAYDEWVGSSRIRERAADLAIASVEHHTVVVDHDTPEENLNLPAEVEVVLTDRGKIVVGVEWDTATYDGTEAGEYHLTGELVSVPVNVANPDELGAVVTVRVRDEGGSVSLLRIGGETDIDGLLFYIEHDEGLQGFYFGTSSAIDLTHVTITDRRGRFVAMIVFDADMYPIQWVFPEMTIAVTTPRGESFDPRTATHVFAYDEESNFTVDIELDMAVGELLDLIPEVYGSDLGRYIEHIGDTVEESAPGTLSRTVRQVVGAAGTPHEVALAALLSVSGTGIRILEKLESVAGEDGGACRNGGTATVPSSPGVDRFEPAFVPLSSVSDEVRSRVAQKLLKAAPPLVRGPVYDMASYLYRIASGHYDGRDIEGPAVSMLLCKGASSVPNVCNEFYIPNVPGGITRCVEMCFATLACFTDICHPMMFSVGDALKLRQP